MIQQTILFNGFMTVSLARLERAIQFVVSEISYFRQRAWQEGSADLPGGDFVEGCFPDLAQFEYPTWGEVV